MEQQREPGSQLVERQHVPMSWALVVAAFWSTFVIAVAAYLPPWVTLFAAVLTGVPLGGWLLYWGNTAIRVGPEGVRAGRALLEWEYAGEPKAMDRVATRNRLGPGASVKAWLATKPWLPEAVELPVKDAADPHPYWLIGSRDSAALAAAIRSHRPTADPCPPNSAQSSPKPTGPDPDDSGAIG